jgi:hypothetical protein
VFPSCPKTDTFYRLFSETKFLIRQPEDQNVGNAGGSWKQSSGGLYDIKRAISENGTAQGPHKSALKVPGVFARDKTRNSRKWSNQGGIPEKGTGSAEGIT